MESCRRWGVREELGGVVGGVLVVRWWREDRV